MHLIDITECNYVHCTLRIIIILMVKRFAIDAQFERPQTCLFELVIFQ